MGSVARASITSRCEAGASSQILLKWLYSERFDLPPKPTLQTALEALLKKELVARGAGGEYRIVEPFLADWLVREQESR